MHRPVSLDVHACEAKHLERDAFRMYMEISIRVSSFQGLLDKHFYVTRTIRGGRILIKGDFLSSGVSLWRGSTEVSNL